jgi:hypothetical protein
MTRQYFLQLKYFHSTPGLRVSPKYIPRIYHAADGNIYYLYGQHYYLYKELRVIESVPRNVDEVRPDGSRVSTLIFERKERIIPNFKNENGTYVMNTDYSNRTGRSYNPVGKISHFTCKRCGTVNVLTVCPCSSNISGGGNNGGSSGNHGGGSSGGTSGVETNGRDLSSNPIYDNTYLVSHLENFITLWFYYILNFEFMCHFILQMKFFLVVCFIPYIAIDHSNIFILNLPDVGILN